MGELEDIRRVTLMHFMGHSLIIIKQLMKTMFPDYQSLTAVTLVSIFGLTLVAVVKDLAILGTVLCYFIYGGYSSPTFVGSNYYCESGPEY